MQDDAHARAVAAEASQARQLRMVPLFSRMDDSFVEDIKRRDARDSGRESAPMRAAPDADLLETSELDIEAAFAAAVGLIKRKIGR